MKSNTPKSDHVALYKTRSKHSRQILSLSRIDGNHSEPGEP
jgi:hypothetical protein